MLPLLIYDDTCYWCGKFAYTARRLSRGHIDIIGHYSDEGKSVKSKIFPEGFNPNTMFWLVKGNRTYGGRSGLIPVAAEIVKGLFRPTVTNHDDLYNKSIICTNEGLSCNKPNDFVKRILNLLKSGKKIEIEELN